MSVELLGAIAATLAAVTGIATIGLTVWFRRHPRLAGGPWLVRSGGPNAHCEIQNNTGYEALEVTLSSGLRLDDPGPYDRVDAGASVFPYIICSALGPRIELADQVLTVTWRTPLRRQRSYRQRIAL
jgi:hypothetical protein